jgi:hypothetical protein
MDILYYSQYCKHSQKIIQFFVKNNLADQVNIVCIDKRKVHPTTGQIYILLENGTQILLPPNIHSVPSLLMVKQNYNVILGDAIMAQYQSKIKTQMNVATMGQGEPMGVSLFSLTGNGPVVSEQYTNYSASPEELSAKGSGEGRFMFNYVPASGDAPKIQTPPDTYRPDKISQSVTVDSLQQIRNEDIGTMPTIPAFMPTHLSTI